GHEQTLPHAGRKAGLEEHFFEIVDEVRAAESVDPLDLLVARALEKHLVPRKAEAVRIEELLRCHPPNGRVAKIRPRFVVACKLGLVADDVERQSACAALANELCGARHQLRLRHAWTVNQALYLLPLDLAVG